MFPGDVGGGGHVDEAGQAVEVMAVAVRKEAVGLATEKTAHIKTGRQERGRDRERERRQRDHTIFSSCPSRTVACIDMKPSLLVINSTRPWREERHDTERKKHF